MEASENKTSDASILPNARQNSLTPFGQKQTALLTNALESVSADENIIEGSPDSVNQMQAELLKQLRRWAVILRNMTIQNPLKPDPAIIGADGAERLLRGVQDVVFLLSTLLGAHKSKRAALVGM